MALADADREEREEADARNDLGAAQRAREEASWIEQGLRAAFALVGRPQRDGDRVERARKAVYARIRATLRAIERVHPALGRHLDRSVRTGTCCVYRPEKALDWTIARGRRRVGPSAGRIG